MISTFRYDTIFNIEVSMLWQSIVYNIFERAWEKNQFYETSCMRHLVERYLSDSRRSQKEVPKEYVKRLNDVSETQP